MKKVQGKGPGVERPVFEVREAVEKTEEELAQEREAEALTTRVFGVDAVLADLPAEATIGDSIAGDVRCIMRVLDVLREARARGEPLDATEAIRGVAADCCRVAFARFKLSLILDLPHRRGAAKDGWTLHNAVPVIASQGVAFARLTQLEHELLEATRDPRRRAEDRTGDLVTAYVVVSNQVRKYGLVAHRDAGPAVSHGFFAAGWRAVQEVARSTEGRSNEVRERLRRGVAACTFLTALQCAGFADEEAGASHVDAFAAFMLKVKGSELMPALVARAALRALGWTPGRFTASPRRKKAPKPSKPRPNNLRVN